MKRNNIDPDFNAILVDCVGCKWTYTLLKHIENGTNRPGQLVKYTPGLSTKVLNQNLLKMQEYKLINKHAFAEIPPRVEYTLTDFGNALAHWMDEATNLNQFYRAQID